MAKRLAHVGGLAGLKFSSYRLGPWSARHCHHRLEACRALQGGARVSTNASSSACPTVRVLRPSLDWSGLPTQPWVGPHCSFLPLWLSGRDSRPQWAVGCEPGWGYWRWVESRDGWP